jgi:TolA-binding protein
MSTSKIKIKVISICALIFICQLCFGICHYPLYAQDNKEEEALFVAKKAFEDKFYEVSLGLLDKFLKNFPDSDKAAEVNLLIGQCYFYQNRFLDALSKFEELLKQPAAKNIKDAVLYWIAEVNFKGNSFTSAAKYYKTIIDEFPKSSYLPAAYYSLGWCLFQDNSFQEALECFKTVEERYSKEPQARDVPFKIIECLYNLKDYAHLKERAKSYTKTYSKDPTRLSYLYFYMAEADYYLNNFNDSVDEYSLVLKNSGDEKIQGLSMLGIGWSYSKLKLYKEAEVAFSGIKQENLEKRSCDALLLGKAIVMVETNRAEVAKNIYDELLKSTSDPLVLIQAYLGKADCLYSLAEYENAINAYKEALAKAGIESTEKKGELVAPAEIIDKLHYGLAWAFLKHGEFKEAIKEFQKIVKTSDDKIVKVSALCQIGDAYQDSGDYNKAQETYDTILKDYPDSFYGDYVQYQLGLTLLKNSNYDAAILSFLALKRNFPESKLLDKASYALGLAYFQRQDYNSGKEVFEKFQEEFKQSDLRPQAMYLLGTSLYNLGNFNGAIEVFKDIIRTYNQDTELTQKAEYEIADCFYQMGNEKEAMNRFKSLRSKYPDSGLTPEIMWWLAGYHFRQNEPVLARRYLTSLIQDFPKSNLVADAYYALGSSYEEESKHEEAVDNFKKVLELSKSELSGQARIAMADVYVKQGKSELALSIYNEIVKEYPNLASLIYPKMGDLFYATGDLTQALDFYRKALDKVPAKEMPAIQFKIGEVLQARGETQEAVQEYLKVTYLYAENSSLAVKALLRVAEIYESKENFKEAVNIYNRIVSLNTEEAKYAKERIDWIKAHVK